MSASSTAADRGSELLDQALRLVAEGGLSAITHRSVEAAADAPHGSVTYWFGSRDGLVAAMVERLVGASKEQAGAIADRIEAARAAGAEPDLDAVAEAVASWIDGLRDLHLARLELELAAARDPRLRERMSEAAAVFWRMCEPLAVAAGSDDPARDGRAIAAMVDGLLLDRLAHEPASEAVLVAALRQVLRTGEPPS